MERINVVEPDGTLRMAISNRSLAPGIIIKGKEHPHPDRKTAAVIFYNDEGTENGGLSFGGERSKDGTESSSGHLSFDRYEQDQVFTITSTAKLLASSRQQGERSDDTIALDQQSYHLNGISAARNSSHNNCNRTGAENHATSGPPS